MSGWIAISRDLFKHEFFAREPMSEREAWVWMIAKAAWEDTKHRIGSDMVDVPRGSFFCTLRELQSAWGWASDKRVRTFLKRTQEERMTEVKTDAGKTQVTICNYDDFQHDGRKKDAAGTQERTQKRRTKEQDNNPTNEQEGREPSGSQCVAPPIDEIAQAVTAYNAAASRSGWPEVKVVSQGRRSALRKRLAECGGATGWEVALSKAEASDFLTGRTDRPFFASFDWITTPKNFAKIMEGNYDNRANPRKQQPANGRENRSDPALEQIARLAGLGQT